MRLLRAVSFVVVLSAGMFIPGSNDVCGQWPSGWGPGNCKNEGGTVYALFAGWGTTFESAAENCDDGPGCGCECACQATCGSNTDNDNIQPFGFPFQKTVGEETGFESPCGCKCTTPI